MKPIKIFISHKRNDGKALPITEQIADRLEKMFIGNNVFLDVRKIHAADQWADKIKASLRQTDVFVLLLRKEIKDSEWIKFEVGMVLALQIGMLLVLTEPMKETEIEEIEKKLGIENIQRFNNNIVFDKSDEQFALLKRDIEKICTKTRAVQAKWINKLGKQRALRPSESELSIASVSLSNYGYPNGCQFHLAKGDITELRSSDIHPAFDVIVNSENHYMQMARLFESGLSGALRRGGAHLDEQHRLIKDSVQDELDMQIRTRNLRPITDRSVIVTHAGHPESDLVKQTGARYIFHAASVRVDSDEKRDRSESLVSSEDGMKQLVHRCLKRVNKVNESNGIVFLKDTPEYEQDLVAAASYLPIRRIIFPIFGTGNAGANVSNAVIHILRAIKRFPHLDPTEAAKLTLTDIYLCAYYDDYAKIVRSAMRSILKT